MQGTNTLWNNKNDSANSIATARNTLFWSLSQTVTALNFSVEFYIFISLLLYECHTGRFKGKLSDQLIIGKIITVLCPLFAMLNLILTEVMILADKLLTQHRHIDTICRVVYEVRPFTYSLAVLTPYIFLWYRVLNLYKVDSFNSINTRSFRVLKVGVLCTIILCVFIGTITFFVNDVHHMTGVGCKHESNGLVESFVGFWTLPGQILFSVVLISLMLYPLLSYQGTFSEDDDDVTIKLVRKATKVSIVVLAVAMLVDSDIFVLFWFYPVNLITLPILVLFDCSVLVKNISILFFFNEPSKMLFGWWRKSGVNDTI